MKYLKTYEQISQGEEGYILVKDKWVLYPTKGVMKKLNENQTLYKDDSILSKYNKMKDLIWKNPDTNEAYFVNKYGNLASAGTGVFHDPSYETTREQISKAANIKFKDRDTLLEYTSEYNDLDGFELKKVFIGMVEMDDEFKLNL